MLMPQVSGISTILASWFCTPEGSMNSSHWARYVTSSSLGTHVPSGGARNGYSAIPPTPLRCSCAQTYTNINTITSTQLPTTHFSCSLKKRSNTIPSTLVRGFCAAIQYQLHQCHQSTVKLLQHQYSSCLSGRNTVNQLPFHCQFYAYLR